MIQAYPGRASVLPGEVLALHVSTDRPLFRVHFLRWDGDWVPVLRSAWLRGEYTPLRAAHQDWQWPAFQFEVPANWPSAVYLAWCETQDAPSPSLYMDQAAALFVVRGSGRSPLLYQLPLATWHAYNDSGGACFYHDPCNVNANPDEPPGARLSLQRPGGGSGGPVWGAADFYDSGTPRNCFAHWDAHFIRWLLRQGYAPEFCTGLDVHSDPDLCRRYRLLLSAGHDEYWSEVQRDHVEDFIAQGGNVAFFGANLCWWRIHLVDDGRAMVCHQGGPHGALDHWWPQRPEDALGGLSYRHGGGWWDGPRRSGGYVVQQPDHWVFAGSGLRLGETFGYATAPPLVGYECDGAPLGACDADSGLAQLSPCAAAAGTPATFCLLASSVLDEGWQERPARERDRDRGIDVRVHAACMGVYARNGTVFHAGTTDWVRVLGSGQEPRVDRITTNVLNRLLTYGGPEGGP